MKEFARLASSPRWSAAVMVAVISSLCFSVGEGLRLTPFPVSATTQIEEINNLAPANEGGSSSIAKYGPLGVPSPVQKRSKRQTTDLDFPPLAVVSQFVDFISPYAPDESIQLRSSRFLSRPAGRAPPPAS